MKEPIMSNKDAANILRDLLSGIRIPRGYGKTTRILMNYIAISKAIKVLENTPDDLHQ